MFFTLCVCVCVCVCVRVCHSQDARAVALTADPSLGSSFVKALFPVLYELFNSMVAIQLLYIQCVYMHMYV